jgi:pimeloyl-ACP methyl ester carboxylesterase/membrane protease YdiL (CAAX protease family)
VFTHLSELAKGLIFYGIVVVLAIGITFVPLDGETMPKVSMFIPLCVVLLMLLVVTRDGRTLAGWASLGLHRAGIQGWPLAILVPTAVVGLAYALVWAMGVATYTDPGMDAAGWAVGLAQGILGNVVVATLTFSIAEEIGWRGYLLPRLASALGNTRGMALTGLLHGVFHLPLILLTPYYHPDGNRLIFVPLFLAAFTIGGLLYGYVRLVTNSTWPAGLAHSTHNYVWNLLGGLTVATSPVAAEYLAGESGILIIVGYGIAAAWLLRRLRAHESENVVPVGVALPTRGALTGASMWTVIKRASLTVVALPVVLAAIGFGYETVMAAGDARSFPAPGRTLDVDGHAMHLACTGTGSPTVVMDAGLGGWSMDWSEVQPSVARSTRVCTYDRPGMGWSSPPRDAQHAVAELHALLTNAAIDGPLVLVGHSNGGLRVLLYAAQHREDVVGLVLVDPTPISTDEEQFAALSPGQQAELLALSREQQSEHTAGGQPLVGLIQAAQPLGLARLLLSDGLLASTIYPHLGTDVQPAYRAGVNRASYLSTIAAEAEQRQASIDQVRRTGALGGLPLLVLVSTEPTAFYGDPVSPDFSGRAGDLMQGVLDDARQAIARLSSNGRVEAVLHSGHYIQFDRPDAVIRAIQEMVVAAR